MANEYKLPYKGEEIVARLRKIDELATEKYVDQAIPKKLSELDNDEGYLKSFTETDPTVPSWAKSPTKPSYGPSEVGAEPEGSVNAHNTATNSHNDIRVALELLDERLSALANSDDTTMEQIAELVEYIQDNKDLIQSITTEKVNVSDIIDNLTTTISNKPLSAAQGVALKALIDAIKIPTSAAELGALPATGGTITGEIIINTTTKGYEGYTGQPAMYILHTGMEDVGDLVDMASFAVFAQSPFGLKFKADGNGNAYIQSQRINSTNEMFPLLLNPYGGPVYANGVQVATKNDIIALNNRLATLEAAAVSIYSGTEAPTADIGQDGDIYLAITS